MASSSSSSPSLPVLSSQSWNYDVFLSFRGVDTRKTFVDHLYKALDQQGIFTYKDDVTLERGDSINPALLKAIEESQIAVIVFSKNYANSKWCLDELTHIMKLWKEGKQTVMPIFYDVEPTEVRHQKQTYGEAFDKHEGENPKTIKSWIRSFLNGLHGLVFTPQAQPRLENKEKVESWRKTLKEVSNISGWEIEQIANGHEAQGIEIIVDVISQRLLTSRENEDLVGMRTRVQDLKSKLQIEAGGVRMIGVWGVGGGGKTTLASYIYDDISSMFDSCCFVNNIREESSSKNGLEKLQTKLLSDILKKTDVLEVRRVEEGRSRIKAKLGRKKVLIVLDDVDQVDQLRALAGSRDSFGQGSRIIITTRDEHMLKAHGVDVIQPISLFNNDEAIQLFCKYAHRDLKPPKDFEKLSKEVVSYADGLPLALKVLGSFLCGRTSMQWKSALNKLKDIPHKDIIGILRISFDGLEQDEKDMFLDIACFYMWETKDRAMERFDAFGFHPGIGLEVLRQKALIVIDDDGSFDMHDVVLEMAQYIVREKHPRNPEKHSRVWKREDVERILHMAATTELDNIEAIDQRGLSDKDKQRFLQVAGNMNKLRWIDLSHLEWGEEHEQSDENIVPLPSNFPPTQLCYLKVVRCISKKHLWEGYKYLPNLTHVELISLRNLIKIPDFSGLPKLEKFKVEGCRCLKEIHPGIGSLESLVLVSIRRCPLLRKFQSITRIKKIETLVLSNICFEDEERYDLWELPNLEKLDLSENSSITRLDFSILRLPRLKWLDVSWCVGLVELVELPSSVAVVDANRCDSFKSFGDVSNCKWLWNVSLDEWNKLDQENGDTLIHSMLQGNALEDHCINVALYEHRLPNGLIDRFFRGNFRVHLPDDWYNDFCGFLVCVVFYADSAVIDITMKQEDPPFDLSHESDEVVEPIYESYGLYKTCVGYVPFSSLSDSTTSISSYNIISVTLRDKYNITRITKDKSFYGGIKLIPRKSKSDEMKTIDWDEKLQDADLDTFTLQECDSDSSIKLSWEPFFQSV